MRVLWITNLFFPEFYSRMGQKAPVMGGWMKSMADSLKSVAPDIEIAVASPLSSSGELIDIYEGDYRFFGLPTKANNIDIDNSIIRYWKRIKELFSPDVVHIHGSEFTHGYGWILANGNDNVIVSIQGLVSAYARYNEGGINFSYIRDLTLRDLLLCDFPAKGHQRLERAGKNEVKLIKAVNHVIGRTTWDLTHVWADNPNCKYHFCNENLRDPFYNGKKWSTDTCHRHRIFLSQAAKPIKGIQKVIEALPLILREYPDTEVYVAGNDFTKKDSLHKRIRYSGFARYIDHLIDSNDVRDKIHFTGFLEAEAMAEQYRKANVFICPSSIENSPNSLGEAQLIGTPVVASYVGGTPDMIEDGYNGLLYRYEEHEMMAYAVCRIFADDTLATTLSSNGIETASIRHNRETNAELTLRIYNELSK